MTNPLLLGRDLPRISFAREAVPGLVSVITPAWHAETHIAATLSSLGRQSYADWELVVVEDGSADSTERLVADFAAAHPRQRVRYLRHDVNRGPSAARNTGFAQARGQFIALLDADDSWLPDHLAESVGCLEREGSDIAYSAVILVDDRTGIPFGACGPTVDDLACFPLNLLARNCVLPSATVLRREVIRDVGGWNPRLRCAEDAFYWLACARAGKRFSYLPGVRCVYTKNRAGAATQRVAQTAMSYAWVVEAFLADPAGRPWPVGDREARRRIADIYHAAARHHLKGGRRGDASADPRLAYACALKAWRFQPLRLRSLRLLLRAAVRAALAGRSASLLPADPAAPATDRSLAAA